MERTRETATQRMDRDARPRGRSSHPPPLPRARPLTILEEITGKLRALAVPELVDVNRYAERVLAARGAAPDPSLLSRVLATLLRLIVTYRELPGVPVTALRVELQDVPRPVLDQTLRDAEDRGFLRLVAIKPPVPFTEPTEGIPSMRGLLYYCAPHEAKR